MQLLGTIDGLQMQAVVDAPTDVDMESPETVFVDGLSIDAGYEFGESSYSFSFTEESETMQGEASAESGEMSIMASQSGFAYSGGATAPSVSFQGGGVPFPVEISMAEYSYGIDLPLAASEEPEPFSLQLLLSELTINDEIWSMIDPQGMLDHQPATVSLDLSGAVALDFDVLDPAQMPQMMMADVPGELEEVTLNDLNVSVAGAQLTGEGAFTFDNSDLETFGGMPAPEGSATFSLTGANQLIDTLVEMGLVPEQQVMGARMMMGMFARQVGEDQLESNIEINEEGHIIVNGQRIQ
ncbi:DUF2125 domain-containing protein [Histidinibacterium aquaticum]|uniref:DUF2125 domain-containing protein n=2 Tax=Histidinibacterium aquaticum TaxID=2613962 RepID=A0A5J5GD92_9RHOB|nr:DUF2125 domain-containing protein [Histidinibacterium aquaticum]